MNCFLMCLPIVLSAALGMTLQCIFKIYNPATYWTLGAIGMLLTFFVAVLLGIV